MRRQNRRDARHRTLDRGRALRSGSAPPSAGRSPAQGRRATVRTDAANRCAPPGRKTVGRSGPGPRGYRSAPCLRRSGGSRTASRTSANVDDAYAARPSAEGRDGRGPASRNRLCVGPPRQAVLRPASANFHLPSRACRRVGRRKRGPCTRRWAEPPGVNPNRPHGALFRTARRFPESSGRRGCAARFPHRFGSGLGLVMLDPRTTSSVNDTLRHHRGDVVLREWFRRTCLRIPSRARFYLPRATGGESCAVVLPGTDLEGAL